MILTRAEFEILKELSEVKRRQEKTMAKLADILAAQAQEKSDLAALVAVVQALLAAFVAGTISEDQAASILAEMQAEDASITSLSTAVSAALPPAPPAPPATPVA